MTIYKALTIAGSDSGGGAGIQADLKTFQELDVYGMSAITAVTAQNTLGVQGVYPLEVDAIVEQIKSVAADLRPHAIKTGMLFSSQLIRAICTELKNARLLKIIVDPVMVAKGGASLLQEEAIVALKNELLPIAYVVTPNIPEAEVLTGMKIETLDDRKEAATLIHRLGAKHVVMKGGHDTGDVVIDLLFDGSDFTELYHPRKHTKHTHGTGCTFAAAITAEIAKGKSVLEAVKTAKAFIQAAIEDELAIGSGHGPTNHSAYRKRSVIA
ncbi:bifunctional hydroxymethylpyrimidine kinase/phosphomethylpyrimidine kinase [Bacillus timonensis]|nr:bifunctional hydroxymethylpyrimidine kinase/phosphomethylpyrimidine kinase [Bacillus timonensis]